MSEIEGIIKKISKYTKGEMAFDLTAPECMTSKMELEDITT
jgi:hypothetical protein